MNTDEHRKLCEPGGLGVRLTSAFMPWRPGNSHSVNPVNPFYDNVFRQMRELRLSPQNRFANLKAGTRALPLSLQS